MSAAMTTARPTRTSLGVPRASARAGAVWFMPSVKAAWCCQHVCGFRYADDMLRLVSRAPVGLRFGVRPCRACWMFQAVLRSAPGGRPTAWPHTAPRRSGCLLAARAPRRSAIGCRARWATRIFGGVREVLHAVLADALGELEARLLLLRTRLFHEARWLQTLARADGLLPLRGARIHRRPSLYAIDDLARRFGSGNSLAPFSRMLRS